MNKERRGLIGALLAAPLAFLGISSKSKAKDVVTNEYIGMPTTMNWWGHEVIDPSKTLRERLKEIDDNTPGGIEEAIKELPITPVKWGQLSDYRVNLVMRPKDYLMQVLGYSEAEADEIMDHATEAVG
jgi:hypothetical protein